MISCFIILQAMLFLSMVLHDWVDIPPLTDLPAMRKAHSLRSRLLGSCINAGLVLLPLIVTLLYLSSPMPTRAGFLLSAFMGFSQSGLLPLGGSHIL